LFFGYDGLGQSAAYSARKLAGLLYDLFVEPGSIVNATLAIAAPRRNSGFSYSRLTFAAHSLGAVVLRRSLLDLARDPTLRTKLGIVRMVLYAPAHMGADILPLARLALNAFKLPAVEPYVKWRWPPLKDLEPGSQALTRLLEETTAEIVRSERTGCSCSHLIAQCVVHAEKDRIVSHNAFADDPPLTPLDDLDHLDVCKPEPLEPRPLEVLLSQV